MKPENLKQLYIHELQDLYSAEKQQEQTLPRLADKVSNAELKKAFQTHLEETRNQLKRLEQVFEKIGEKPGGHTCEAMKGIVKEAEQFIEMTHPAQQSDSPEEVIDAGIIAMAQRAEVYEISGYGTAATYAETLGRSEEHDLLGETLAEEKKTDELLTRIAEKVVNPEAATA